MHSIENLRINARITRQWETLSGSILILWIMIILLGVFSITLSYRVSKLQAEIEALKSR